MIATFAAGAPHQGWSNEITLFVIAPLAMLGIYRLDLWWKRRNGSPSPTAAAAPEGSEKPQVRPVSSQPSHETPALEPARVGARDGRWYGRIVKTPDGFRRVYETARHIARTGESPQPEEPAHHEPEDDDADDFLDLPVDDPAVVPAPYEPDSEFVDDIAEDDMEEDVAGDDAEPEPVAVVQVRETREQYAARLVAKGKATPAVVAGLIEHYGVSRATAYRLVAAAEQRAA